MRTVFTAEHPAQAHLVAGLLEEEGIRCVVQGEMLDGARFALCMDSSTLPTVDVDEADVPRATALLRERGHAAAEAGSAAEEQIAQPGLGAFKKLLLVLVALSVVGLGYALIVEAFALAIGAAFFLVLTLVTLLPRRR